jgi:hypothetical protein
MPQTGDVGPKGRRGSVGAVGIGPEVFGEPVDIDDPVDPDGKEGKEPALSTTADADRAIGALESHSSKDLEGKPAAVDDLHCTYLSHAGNGRWPTLQRHNSPGVAETCITRPFARPSRRSVRSADRSTNRAPDRRVRADFEAHLSGEPILFRP